MPLGRRGLSPTGERRQYNFPRLPLFAAAQARVPRTVQCTGTPVQALGETSAGLAFAPCDAKAPATGTKKKCGDADEPATRRPQFEKTPSVSQSRLAAPAEQSVSRLFRAASSLFTRYSLAIRSSPPRSACTTPCRTPPSSCAMKCEPVNCRETRLVPLFRA